MIYLKAFVLVYLVSLVVSSAIYTFEHFFRRSIIRSGEDALGVLAIVGVPIFNTVMLGIIIVAITLDYVQERKRKAMIKKGIIPINKSLQVIHIDAIKRKLQVNASESK